jgi:hypothetical protein
MFVMVGISQPPLPSGAVLDAVRELSQHAELGHFSQSALTPWLLALELFHPWLLVTTAFHWWATSRGNAKVIDLAVVVGITALLRWWLLPFVLLCLLAWAVVMLRGKKKPAPVVIRPRSPAGAWLFSFGGG